MSAEVANHDRGRRQGRRRGREGGASLVEEGSSQLGAPVTLRSPHWPRFIQKLRIKTTHLAPLSMESPRREYWSGLLLHYLQANV